MFKGKLLAAKKSPKLSLATASANLEMDSLGKLMNKEEVRLRYTLVVFWTYQLMIIFRDTVRCRNVSTLYLAQIPVSEDAH